MRLISQPIRILPITVLFSITAIGIPGCTTTLQSPATEGTSPDPSVQRVDIPENFRHAREHDDGSYFGIVEDQSQLEAIWGQLQAHDSHGRRLSRNEVLYPEPPSINFRREYVIWVSLLRAGASSTDPPELSIYNGYPSLTINIHHDDISRTDLVMWRVPKTSTRPIVRMVHVHYYGP